MFHFSKLKVGRGLGKDKVTKYTQQTQTERIKNIPCGQRYCSKVIGGGRKQPRSWCWIFSGHFQGMRSVRKRFRFGFMRLQLRFLAPVCSLQVKASQDCSLFSQCHPNKFHKNLKNKQNYKKKGHFLKDFSLIKSTRLTHSLVCGGWTLKEEKTPLKRQ